MLAKGPEPTTESVATKSGRAPTASRFDDLVGAAKSLPELTASLSARSLSKTALVHYID